MERKHHVLYVDPRSEKKVESELTRIGIQSYVPVRQQLRQWKDRKHWTEQVLFNSYVFVDITPQRKNDVFLSSHVKRYVQFEGKPACLSNKDIDLIHKLCKLKNEVEITQERFSKGQCVEIIQGDLMGYQGMVCEESRGKILRIKILGLGCFAQVALDAFSVRVI